MPWWAILLVLLLKWITERKHKKPKNEEIEIRNGWAYNESARMWVAPEQLDEEKNRRAYEENRQRWEQFQKWEELQAQLEADPDYLSQADIRQANEIWKKHKVAQEPSFEEWKAAKQKKQGSEATNSAPK